MAKNKVLRVTQMDASYLDREIHNVLVQIVQDCMKCLPPGFAARFEPELNLIVKVAILSYSVLKDDQSFGQKLLSLKYKNLSHTKKWLFLLFNCSDYFRCRIESLNLIRDTSKLLNVADVIIKICSFINVSIFLYSGSKPRFIERILGLEQMYTSDVHRQFGSKYMTRELLWNGFIEILVYILPFINYPKIKRIIRSLNILHKKSVRQGELKRVMTVDTRCPHCGESPILPHHMGCSHIFCYSCLKGNQIADPKYMCPLCECTSSSGQCEKLGTFT